MLLTTKSILLLAAILLTGLSAGFFYAWEVSVIPGTRKISDQHYLETMQSINRAILNPAFFLVFMGSLALLALSTFQYYGTGAAFRWLLAATLTYLMGTFGVTAFGNVPLNNTLDVLDLSGQATHQLATFRKGYESNWNRLHTIRTVFSVLSFLFALLGAFATTRI